VNVLVTGATGFLGQHVCERLVAAGHRVRGMARSRPASALEGVEIVLGDLRERDCVRQALDGIEVVYHLAGRVSFEPEHGRQMYELHVDCTRQLLHEAKDARIQRFVLASTSGTIAVSKEDRLGTEADDYPIAVVGRWPYYLSKIYEEKLALEYCQGHSLPLVVLNPSLLMGPGDERLSSTWTVLKFLNREIPAMPSGGISFVDVRDAADAFVQALTRGELYGRHLMGVNMLLSEFFGRLERLTGVPAPRLKLPSSANVWGAHLLERWAKVRGTEAPIGPQSVDIGEHFFYLDPAKAERELGFRARDPHDTLFDTVEFLMKRMPPQALPGVRGELAQMRAKS
jgi:dihydroflavonol-4-reductase